VQLRARKRPGASRGGPRKKASIFVHTPGLWWQSPHAVENIVIFYAISNRTEASFFFPNFVRVCVVTVPVLFRSLIAGCASHKLPPRRSRPSRRRFIWAADISALPR